MAKSKGGGKQQSQEDGPMTMMDQPKLQAVLLADSPLSGCPSSSFQPVSLDEPMVLCPLNNVTLLSYALDCLAGNGVEQVFVVCTNDAVKEYLSGVASPNGNDSQSQQRQQQEKLQSSSWQGQLTVEVIKDTSLKNAGDALRELYKRNVIKSDPFLLLYGDVVTNMDLRQAMELHKARHVSDSSAIMTVVLSENGGDPTMASPRPGRHATTTTGPMQSAKNDLVIAYDESHQDRILLYDNKFDSKSVNLPCSFFVSHPGMTVRTDLSDTGVYICSPDVLGRFEDEFDYRDIAKNFITNCVAEEEEGLQTRIHAHILPPQQYAARVVDWATYHTISNDLLKRWCYPMVPDNLSYYASSSGGGQGRQQTTPGSSTVPKHSSLYIVRNYPCDWYKDTLEPSKIARSVKLTGSGILGNRGRIEDDVTIHGSVIGHNVQIGRHVVLSESHIWDGVIVEDSANVSHSVLARNVVIKKGAVVNKCVIGQGCVIGEGIVLPEYTRVTLRPPDEDPFGDDDDDGDWGDDDDEEDDDDDDDDDSPGNVGASATTSTENVVSTSDVDPQLVGRDGKGHAWQPSLEDEDGEDDSDDENEEKDLIEGLTSLHLQSIGTDLHSYYQTRLHRQSEEIDDLSDSEVDPEADIMAFDAYTDGTIHFDESPSIAPAPAPVAQVQGRQRGVDVVRELKEICMEYDDSGSTTMDNLAIELNSYKFSQNASYVDCAMAAILVVVDKMEITAETKDAKLVAGIKQKIKIWSPLLKKMCMGSEEEMAIIHGLERAATAAGTPAAERLSSGVSFRFFLESLHDEEVLNEESILAWADEREKSQNGPDFYRLESVQKFLEWLREDDESTDDDDDDDDDDSS